MKDKLLKVRINNYKNKVTNITKMIVFETLFRTFEESDGMFELGAAWFLSTISPILAF